MIHTFKTIRYGQMVKYTDISGAVNNSHKVWFFNQTRVFLGDIYRFVPYCDVAPREDGIKWERSRGSMFKLACNIITVLIRFTQRINLN